MSLDTNFTSVTNESWFILFDILMILSTTFSIILTSIFLSIIIVDKTCRTVPMMLVANSCLVELIFGCDMLFMISFTFKNDLKQIEYEDSLCVFRDFVSYIAVVLQNYSYLLQAIYRYVTVISPTRLFLQSVKFEGFLIYLTWIFCFVYSIPVLLIGEIQYNVNNQICRTPLQLSFIIFYNTILIYIVPISLIMLIYIKLIQYVKEMNKRVMPANTLFRAQRELKMVRQIVVLIFGITTLGSAYAILIFISFFTIPPKYHFRLAYIYLLIYH